MEREFEVPEHQAERLMVLVREALRHLAELWRLQG
jgi:hypothetical protein